MAIVRAVRWTDALQSYAATLRPDVVTLNKLLRSFRKPGHPLESVKRC